MEIYGDEVLLGHERAHVQLSAMAITLLPKVVHSESKREWGSVLKGGYFDGNMH